MKNNRFVGWICVTAVFAALVAQAAVTPAPVPAGALKMKRMMKLSNTGSVYNPRICNGEVFAVDISAPVYSAGRFLEGSTTPDVEILGVKESRMISPLDRTSKTWILSAGGSTADTAYFSLWDYATMTERVDDTNLAIRPNAFDWVDSDTVISASYQSGQRNRLYLVDIATDPSFTVTLNTSWNVDGYVEAPLPRPASAPSQWATVTAGMRTSATPAQTKPRSGPSI
ncbi:MAG TPA: hypothetical protein P5125_00010 [Kiritimatiellia bacterium]|nr:hypothetical protein [Kiritimatiellia bacterium]HRU18717.1 hypothetical protein [Kiritimatiellia bacterium]